MRRTRQTEEDMDHRASPLASMIGQCREMTLKLTRQSEIEALTEIAQAETCNET
jgi:hypothetical protein